jgi:hypothetical protein
LRTDARLFADKRPGSDTSFVTETELTRLVNLKTRELYDMLIEARGSDYYANESTVAIVAGTTRYPLPVDFYQLASVTLEWNTSEHELMFPIGSVRQRTPYEAPNWLAWTRNSPKGYRLRASQIEILPEPKSDVTARLQYAPVFIDMVADGDTFDGVNGWEKMIALGVALELMAIEKRTSATVAQMYAEQMARIESLKSERDAEAPKEVVDVQRLKFRNGWYGRYFDDTFDQTFG